MPLKKTAAKEHSVYIVVNSSDRGVSDFTEINKDSLVDACLFGVYADVESANEAAEVHFNGREHVGVGNYQKILDQHDLTMTFKYGDDKHGYDETRVLKEDLIGGFITPIKQSPLKDAGEDDDHNAAAAHHYTGSRRVTRHNTAAAHHYTGSRRVTPAMVRRSALAAGTKRKVSDGTADDEANDDDEHFPSSPPARLAEEERHFAPAGQADCLRKYAFVLVGSLDPWSREQGEALIKFYGGTVVNKIDAHLDFALVGSKPGISKLKELLKPEFQHIKQIGQHQLYDFIRNFPGIGAHHSKEEVTAVCNAAKKPQVKKASHKSSKKSKA